MVIGPLGQGMNTGMGTPRTLRHKVLLSTSGGKRTTAHRLRGKRKVGAPVLRAKPYVLASYPLLPKRLLELLMGVGSMKLVHQDAEAGPITHERRRVSEHVRRGTLYAFSAVHDSPILVMTMSRACHLRRSRRPRFAASSSDTA